MHGLTNGHHLHSYVLMSLFLEHTDYTGMRSLVLARDDITNDAMLSFLAGTRNLMMTDCRMIIFVADICAII